MLIKVVFLGFRLCWGSSRSPIRHNKSSFTNTGCGPTSVPGYVALSSVAGRRKRCTRPVPRHVEPSGGRRRNQRNCVRRVRQRAATSRRPRRLTIPLLRGRSSGIRSKLPHQPHGDGEDAHSNRRHGQPAKMPHGNRSQRGTPRHLPGLRYYSCPGDTSILQLLPHLRVPHEDPQQRTCLHSHDAIRGRFRGDRFLGACLPG